MTEKDIIILKYTGYSNDELKSVIYEKETKLLRLEKENEEFLKSMANEYSKEPAECLLASLCCGSDLPDDENTLEEVKEPIKQAYIDGYKEGLQKVEKK